jgi:hypothetical protein
MVPALLAGLATLGLAGAFAPANALVGGKSGIDNRTPISETANAGVTEVVRRRGRGGGGWKRRGGGGFKSRGRSGGGWKRRGWSGGGWKNRHSSRRHRRNRFYSYGVPLGLGLYLGSRPSYYYNDDYYYYEERPAYRGGRCAHWRDRCADNWGYGNSDYYGCLKYHNCD